VEAITGVKTSLPAGAAVPTAAPAALKTSAQIRLNLAESKSVTRKTIPAEKKPASD
jgi:hypothetical protein